MPRWRVSQRLGKRRGADRTRDGARVRAVLRHPLERWRRGHVHPLLPHREPLRCHRRGGRYGAGDLVPPTGQLRRGNVRHPRRNHCWRCGARRHKRRARLHLAEAPPAAASRRLPRRLGRGSRRGRRRGGRHSPSGRRSEEILRRRRGWQRGIGQRCRRDRGGVGGGRDRRRQQRLRHLSGRLRDRRAEPRARLHHRRLPRLLRRVRGPLSAGVLGFEPRRRLWRRGA